jgi:uncharacterized membrane protein YjjP (DUF1212 family)
MTHASDSRPDDLDDARRFVVEVGKSAHQYGSSSSRIETYLTHLSSALGDEGTFRSTPSEILYAFRGDDETPQQIYLENVPPSGWNLNRLAALGELTSEVESHRATPGEGARRLHEIAALPDPWNGTAQAAALVIAGAGFATMIGGSSWDVAAGGVLGFAVFVTMMLIGRFGGPRLGAWLSLLSAFVVGLLVALARIVQPDVNPIVASVCGLVILVPGYPISIGVLELLTNRVVSGLENLMNGMLTLVQLTAGVWLGYALVAEITSVPEIEAGESVGLVWLFVALIPMLAALCSAMQAPRRDTLATMTIVGCSFIVNFLVGAAVSGMPGVFVATGTAMAVGAVLGTLWNRRTGRPMTVITAQLAMLLTSGTIGFRGLAAATTGQASLGAQQLQQMFVVAFALGAGLLVGYSLLRPAPSL